MKAAFTILFLAIGIIAYGQTCPVIDKRNNGNGQANRCAGVSGSPMADNFVGTPYAVVDENLPKTGDITFVYDEPITNPPAIRRIWIGNVLSSVVAGPASPPEVSGNTTIVKYCFYNENLPPSASFTLEFVDPTDEAFISFCGFSGSDDSNINPPTILTQPLSQSVCQNENINLSVIAESTNGGSLNYQWRKNGVDITNANASTLVITSATSLDEGEYDCLVGESTGSFIYSDLANIQIIDCSSSNVYMDKCGSGNLINNTTDSWNSAWVDYNNDGWEDLFVVDKSNLRANDMYKNATGALGSTTISGITSKEKTAASAWADIDNDGDLDVCIVNATGNASMIYINNGNETFSALPSSGIDVHPQYFHGAAFADFDNDGFVDLILTNFFKTRFHHLYKNNGNNTFSKVENTPVNQVSNRSTTPLLADYNNDGLVDIFIPNGDNQPNSLFKNIGNFQFERITTGSIVTDTDNSVGGAWGDYNGDGFMDLFVTNSSNQNNALYTNNTDGTFTKVTGSITVSDRGHSHGANWIDIDNDADLDLFVTNDNGPNFLYINNGTGSFTRVTDEEIATDLGLNYGQAWADYNKDGFLDVMLSFHSDQKDRLYCNKQNDNTWTNIRLEGTVSNANGIGAQVRVKTDGVWQLREVNPISGFASQNSLRSHFGLGTATVIDSIEVQWPSGIIQYVTNQASNEFITIVEESASNVQGVAFHDINNNCIRDAGEPSLANIALVIEEQNKIVASDMNGQMAFYLKDGSYTISLVESNYWNLSCSNSFAVTGSSTNINIPLQAVSNGYDLSIDYTTSAWRRGFTAESVLHYNNLGTEAAYNSYITLTYPAGVVINEANYPYTLSGDNEYTFNLGTIEPGASTSIIITDSVTLETIVGQDLLVYSSITATGSDLDESNNSMTESNSIVGAIDPNDIAVLPEGEGADKFVSKNETLTYRIRFQNVGTYYASRVYLSFPISEYLDESTFKTVNSSHNFTYNIDERGILRVSFNNIYLPDSTTNEKDSHGFFKFSIKPHNHLVGGEQIKAVASITFDYEDAISTNVLVNTIKFESKGSTYELHVYPNPSDKAVTLSFDKDFYKYDDYQGISELYVYSIQGKLLHHIQPEGSDYTSIDVSDWNNGQYIIKAIDVRNNIFMGRLMKN